MIRSLYLRTPTEPLAHPPCLEWREKGALFLEDRTAEEEEALQQHLIRCPVCREANSFYQLLDQGLQGLALQRPPRKLVEQLSQRLEIAQILEQDNPEVPRRMERISRGRSGRATALQLLLDAFIGKEQAHLPLIAYETGISDRRLNHWLRGISEPDAQEIVQLMEVLQAPLPIFQELLSKEGYSNERISLFPRWEIPQSVYRIMLEKIAQRNMDTDHYTRQISTLFEFALPHLDMAQHGIALTYAQCMPPRERTIRSLFIVQRDGRSPWKNAIDQNLLLGMETLVGQAALRRQPLVWNIREGYREPFSLLDDYEQSACAIPVQKNNRIAGVFLCSSTHAGFFRARHACKLVEEYAHLLACCIPREHFFSTDALQLEVMPALNWQRQVLPQLYQKYREKYQHESLSSVQASDLRNEVENLLLTTRKKRASQREVIESA